MAVAGDGFYGTGRDDPVTGTVVWASYAGMVVFHFDRPYYPPALQGASFTNAIIDSTSKAKYGLISPDAEAVGRRFEGRASMGCSMAHVVLVGPVREGGT